MRQALPAPAPPAPTTRAELLARVRQRAAPAHVSITPRLFATPSFGVGSLPASLATHWHLFFHLPGETVEEDVFLSKFGETAEEALRLALEDPAWKGRG